MSLYIYSYIYNSATLDLIELTLLKTREFAPKQALT